MRQTPFAIVAALVTALMLPGIPATADTIDIEPTSSFAWLDGHASDVTFDPSGRLWVWNTINNPALPHGQQANVFAQDTDGNWDHAFRFRLKRHNPSNVTFSSDGKFFSLDSYNCVLHTGKLKANGKVKSAKKLKFTMRFCPYLVQPINGRKVVLVDSSQIREYKLPLSSRSKPMRTVRFGLEGITDVKIGNDGAVYYAFGDYTNQSVHVVLPTQRGLVEAGRTFSIHADYSPQDIRGMSFTPEGDLALKMGSNVAIFPITTEGENQVPGTFYRFGTEPSSGGGDVAFDANGLMTIVEHAHELPVRIFFDSDCPRSAQAVC